MQFAGYLENDIKLHVQNHEFLIMQSRTQTCNFPGLKVRIEKDFLKVLFLPKVKT